ncbi:MAG: hypothetical protein R3F39_03020 [Myxococcota bacterium]
MTARIGFGLLVLVSLVGAMGSLKLASAQAPNDRVAVEAALEFDPDAVECADVTDTSGRSSPDARGALAGGEFTAIVVEPRSAPVSTPDRARAQRVVFISAEPRALATGTRDSQNHHPMWHTPGVLRAGGANADDPDSTIA